MNYSPDTGDLLWRILHGACGVGTAGLSSHTCPGSS
uniref:Uncharacterized protein n=1 Tax=Anguilla anguilla TaxID=7936 RepID=A0A0E9V320_ANGAN